MLSGETASKLWKSHTLQLGGNLNSFFHMCCLKLLWELNEEDLSSTDNTIVEFRVLTCEKGVGIQGGNVKL